QLAGKPGFAIIQLPVYHDTHSNAMVEVDKQYVLLVFYATAAKLTIGHGPRIVLQIRMYTQGRFDDLAERVFMEIERTVAVTGCAVDAPTEVHTDAKDFFPLYRAVLNKFIDYSA